MSNTFSTITTKIIPEKETGILMREDKFNDKIYGVALSTEETRINSSGTGMSKKYKNLYFKLPKEGYTEESATLFMLNLIKDYKVQYKEYTPKYILDNINQEEFGLAKRADCTNENEVIAVYSSKLANNSGELLISSETGECIVRFAGLAPISEADITVRAEYKNEDIDNYILNQKLAAAKASNPKELALSVTEERRLKIKQRIAENNKLKEESKLKLKEESKLKLEEESKLKLEEESELELETANLNGDQKS